jgi:hypothetical protein
LIVLAGLILIVTPWLVGFATDRAARLDAVVGGIIVLILALAQIYAIPSAPQRLSH